jgi:hypothetical protein
MLALFSSRFNGLRKGAFIMLEKATVQQTISVTRADHVCTYELNSNGSIAVTESTHTVSGKGVNERTRQKKRVKRDTKTSAQRSQLRRRWLESLYNNFYDHGVNARRCAYFTGRFDKATTSVQIAQNRVKRWLDSLPFKVDAWTSVAEYDAGGTVHVHVLIKGSKSILNHRTNYIHDVLMHSWSFGSCNSQRIYDLENLGRYMMMSDLSTAPDVKTAVRDDAQTKANFKRVEHLANVPETTKQRLKKAYRTAHIAKKKAIAKAKEKHNDKIMRKSYGQAKAIKITGRFDDVWSYIAENGRFLGSTITRIMTIDDFGQSHLVNIVKKDHYKLDIATQKVVQVVLDAVKQQQQETAVVA